MVNKTIYLAGGISGLTYDEATEWRFATKAALEPLGIKCLSPMRAAVHLRNNQGLLTDCEIVDGMEQSQYAALTMSTPKGVVTRDKFDCTNCDMLIVNLLKAKRVSIGTMVELGWASMRNIPIVLVMETENNVHDHAFVKESATFRTDSIEEAIEIAKAILGDY